MSNLTSVLDSKKLFKGNEADNPSAERAKRDIS
jgi:hypothetical protein